MRKVGKRICNKLNKLIPCKTQEDIDKLTSMLEDILAHDYNDVYYKIKYGKKIAKCKFYMQIYRTVYYNGYGEVLYVG